MSPFNTDEFATQLAEGLSTSLREVGWADKKRAYLGTGGASSTVIVPPAKRQAGCTFYVYVEKDGAREVLQVANTNASITYDESNANLPVIIGRLSNSVVYQIISPDPNNLNSVTGGALPSQISDVVNAMVTSKNIQEVALFPVSGMILGITAGMVRINQTLYPVRKSTSFVTLTSSIPSTAGKARYTAVFYDGSTSSVVNGSEFTPSSSADNPANYPTTVADGKVFLGMVYLFNGQTTITKAHLFRLQEWRYAFDPKVRVTSNDTTPNYLLAKLAAGTGIILTETNDGGDEDVTISVSASGVLDYKVKVSSDDTTPDYLLAKLAAGNGITLAEVNGGGDEDASITVNQSQLSLASLGTRLLDNLSDVTISAPSPGQFLRYIVTDWQNATANLNDLSDVVISSVAANQSLRYNGSEWVNAQLDHTHFSNIGTNTHAQIDTHIASTSNPHTVTLEQARTANNTALGNITIAFGATTGTVAPSLTVTSAAHTALTTATERHEVLFGFNATQQWTGGSFTNQRHFYIRQPTLAATSATTITNAATLAIEQSPAAAAPNMTITNSRALWVMGGVTRLDGQIQLNALTVISDGQNVQVGSSTGTKWGTSSTQKMGWWDATPVVRSNSWSVTNPSTRKSFDTTTVTLVQLAEAVGTIIDTMKNYGQFGA